MNGVTWTHIGTQYQIIPLKRVENSEEAPYLFQYFNPAEAVKDLHARLLFLVS
jgi:hypothetical protein